MDGRLKRLLAAATTVVAVGVVGVAGADDDPAEDMRSMHDETSMHDEMERHAHMGAGHHRRDMNDVHAEMSRQLSPDDRALHDRMHESCAGHTDERIDT
ncbi:MAG: hypothetical protein KY395_03630 [Actinobacteria bacterium]|nr:hypothetical protein [Actinomycetota bacterium]